MKINFKDQDHLKSERNSNYSIVIIDYFITVNYDEIIRLSEKLTTKEKQRE